MESFNESAPPLVGYLKRDESDLGRWSEVLETKVPLRLVSMNTAWSLEVHDGEEIPFFTLCLGFKNASGSRLWRKLTNVTVIGMHIRADHVFLDVVNMDVGVTGCITLYPEECTVFDAYYLQVSAAILKESTFRTSCEVFLHNKLELVNPSDWLQTCRELSVFINNGFKTAWGVKRKAAELQARHERRKSGIQSHPPSGITPASIQGSTSKGKEVVSPSPRSTSNTAADQRGTPAPTMVTPSTPVAAGSGNRPSGESREAPTATRTVPAGRALARQSITSARDPPTTPSSAPAAGNRSRAPARSGLPGAGTMPPPRSVFQRYDGVADTVSNERNVGEQVETPGTQSTAAAPGRRRARDKQLASKKNPSKRRKASEAERGQSSAVAEEPQRGASEEPTGHIPEELVAVVDEETASSTAVKKISFGTYAKGGRWSEYPDTVPFDPATVPDKLSVKMKTKKKAADKAEELQLYAELQGHVTANLTFKKNAEYMYIFGQGRYFQLDLEDMCKSDPKSGRIYRPLEQAGVNAVLKNMVTLQFNKQILTVMPNTTTRPRNWMECVMAGPFWIINGQHTWAAAKLIIDGKIKVSDKSIKDRLRIWTCEIVWSDNPSHLHTLSYKCNDGNDEQPYLTSAPATVMHLREIWCNHLRPKMCRKNMKYAKGSEEEAQHLAYEVRMHV